LVCAQGRGGCARNQKIVAAAREIKKSWRLRAKSKSRGGCARNQKMPAARRQPIGQDFGSLVRSGAAKKIDR
jgi:hypothetical protein